ncbi:hypothetical protein GCK32_015277 [Trichostrongylus colubriformis]|uniref:Uncharacterized protein n=1 Tax=Trichostrongylus colubriformis TaxID=6319 RepID=A0AAN8F5X0_TRICO
MAAELLKGPLPWSKIDGHKEHKMIMVRKMYIRAEGRADFISGMPEEFDHILSMIDQMKYGFLALMIDFSKAMEKPELWIAWRIPSAVLCDYDIPIDTKSTTVFSTDFFDHPQYELIQSLIDQAAEKLGFTLHEPLDWQQDARVLRKAEFVGELGESNLASLKMDEEGGDSDSDYSLDSTPLDIEPPTKVELKN